MDDYDYDYEDEGINVPMLLSALIGLGIFLMYRRYQSIRNRAIPFFYRAPPEIGPDFEGTKIENPSLDAHVRDASLLPPFALADRAYITCYDPATAFHLATYVADNEADIQHKIARAMEAQQQWKHTSFSDRRRVVRSLKKWLVDNQEVCAKVAARDTGKTLLDAALGEIIVTCSKMDFLIDHGERYLQPESRSNNWLTVYKTSEVHYEPLGTVAAIVSWNYPLHNAWSPILAAIFAGNAIVLKCSEQTVWSTSWFVGAIQECLHACGFNRELVQLVCCYPTEAKYLTQSPYIRHITFIGSERVGRIIVKDATEHLTPVTLELGGKDPAIILPNTDIEKYSSILMRGVYQNAGQNCIGIERIIVHESQYEEVYRMFVSRVKELRVGSALFRPADGIIPAVDCGAMISTERFRDIETILEGAVNHGAVIEHGGQRINHPLYTHGAFFTPTVVGNVSPELPIAQQELFAPIAVIMQYSTIEEAIDIANGTRYGLGASVFGPDQEQCVKVAKLLHCGMVSVNDFAVYYLNQDLPFGGTKMSGYGRFGGPEGLRSLTNPKVIITDRWPWLVQTTIPKVMDYPIPSVTQSWAFVSGLIGFMYGDGWRKRIRYLIQLVNASNPQQPPAPPRNGRNGRRSPLD
ncbi:meiotic sister-chromatid recombination aldehyde dehydrogenase [Panus rudis PR-1116 ss-1]|nr:meiotic sister-chromatid recombination aldehyde dehydrogenase [Panus rudis PR-1116 ss-1]